MGYVNLFAAVLVAFFIGTEGRLRIGLGRFDVTGPSVEVPFVSEILDCDFIDNKLKLTYRWDMVA